MRGSAFSAAGYPGTLKCFYYLVIGYHDLVLILPYFLCHFGLLSRVRCPRAGVKLHGDTRIGLLVLLFSTVEKVYIL